jgi:hypothetical protein
MYPAFIKIGLLALARLHHSLHKDPTHHNIESLHQDDTFVAFVYGTLSAITLPLGAACGCYWVEASETMIAFMVACGAGALLFAVTVELYGEAVDRLETHGFLSGFLEMSATAAGALIGAIVYILCCRWIDWAVENAQKRSNDSPGGSPISPGGRGTRDQPFLESGRIDDVERRKKESPGVYTSREIDHVRGRKRAVMGALDPALHHQIQEESRQGRYGATSSGTRSGARTEEAISDRVVSESACDSKRVNEIRVAIFIWLGALLDGIPEAIMLGYLAAEQKLSVALVMALFVS